jgi:hypothetical protein
MAPLTGLALTVNWLIGKPNLKIEVVKTTRMTNNLARDDMGLLSVLRSACIFIIN